MAAVKYAKKLVEDIEFYAEDAGRAQDPRGAGQAGAEGPRQVRGRAPDGCGRQAGLRRGVEELRVAGRATACSGYAAPDPAVAIGIWSVEEIYGRPPATLMGGT